MLYSHQTSKFASWNDLGSAPLLLSMGGQTCGLRLGPELCEEEPRIEPGFHSLLRPRSAALGDSSVHPILYFVGYPSDSARAQLYPLRKAACYFEPSDVLGRVRDAKYAL